MFSFQFVGFLRATYFMATIGRVSTQHLRNERIQMHYKGLHSLANILDVVVAND